MLHLECVCRFVASAAANAAILICLFALAITNPINAQIAPLSLDQIKAMESAGDYAGAALACEQMYKAGAPSADIMVQKLIDLHLKAGHPDKAVAWARNVKDRMPDPEAFEAGVLVAAGKFKNAATLLHSAIVAETDPARRVRLGLQLADAYAKGGLPGEQSALEQALKDASGPEADMIRRRLGLLIESVR